MAGSSSKPTKTPPTKKPTPTSFNLLGNMQRTVIEGLVNATSRPSSSKAPASKKPTEKAPSKSPSKPSSSTKPATHVSKALPPDLPKLIPSGRPNPASLAPSVLKTKYDVKMASRQPAIDTLSRAEKAEQETWAQGQLKMHGKTCPAELGWVRTSNGYKCQGGFHVVSHKLLAEGRGGMYFNFGLHDKNDNFKDDWIGPLYGQDILDAYFQEGKYEKGKFP